jgi:hypothetical protein
VHRAVGEASRKLAAAGDRGCWRFPMLLFWHSPVYVFRPPQPEWTKDGVLAVACESPGRAIQAVYDRGGVAECYSAQQVAVFAVQYELYGAEWFDSAFAPKDVAVGKPFEIRTTPVGRFTDPDGAYPWRLLLLRPEEAKGDPVVALARVGHRAFSGLTGIVRAQDGDESANQNIIVVSVSPRAADALLRGGGIALWADRAKRAYAALDAAGGLFTSSAVTKAKTAEADAILADPALTEFVVYCHPFGVLTLGALFKWDMQEHDTPVTVDMYVDGREDALFERYRAAWKARWTASQAAAKPPR